MTKSTPKKITPINLSNVTTYQSGVVQSAAFRKLNRVVASFLEAYDLTTMEWFIIGTVYDAGNDGLSLTALKAKLDTTMPFITNSIKNLLAKKVLVKSPHATDARTKIVAIAPHYKATCNEIEKYLRAEMRTMFYKDISPEELQTYVTVLYKLTNL
jgi:DNA-binding MarR family transcriptional regulator